MSATAIVTCSIVVQGTPSQTIEDRHICSDPGNPVKGIEGLRDLLDRMASGLEVGAVHVFVDKADGTQATGQIVCTQASIAAGDTVVIGAVTLTVRATPSSDPRDGEFANGASTDTQAGDNLAAAINAHPLLKAVCTALNSSGTVTLTMVDKGTHGNLYVLSKTGSGFAATTFASGAKGTVESASRAFNRGQ